MKTRKHNRHLTVVSSRQPVYPNAADASYFAGRILDGVTALVSAMGLVSVMLFLVTMS